ARGIERRPRAWRCVGSARRCRRAAARSPARGWRRHDRSAGRPAPIETRGRGPGLMPLVVRVDRHKCIGGGNCITIAPTAFDWLAGDFGKADVVDPDSVDEELLREADFAC